MALLSVVMLFGMAVPCPAQRQAESREAARRRVLANLVANLVYVEGGTFLMGASPEQDDVAFANEHPLHVVTLSPYYIGRYEVTQEEWQTVMGYNPSYFRYPHHPVETVSWDDCMRFVKRLRTLTGRNFRLPTEAEWEYAARGGNRSRGWRYAGADSLNLVGWYARNSDVTSHPVGQKQPNELGLYDMTGNVYEWCLDRYGPYTITPQTNPAGALKGVTRVVRGGSWYSYLSYCHVTFRYDFTPSLRDYCLGLRLACSAE